MLLLVIAAALVIIAIALLPQALAVVGAAGPWPWLVIGLYIASVAVVAVVFKIVFAIRNATPRRLKRAVSVVGQIARTAVCFLVAAILFILPVLGWAAEQRDLGVKVIGALVIWGIGAFFAYAGWWFLRQLLAGREEA